MAEQDPQQDISLETPIGKLAAKGVRTSDLIGIITLLGVAATAYSSLQNAQAVTDHKIESKAINESIANSIKEGAKAQRMMTCIISMPQERREKEFTESNSFCTRMATLP